MGAGAGANLAKHDVSFEEAASAFADALSLTIPDPEHSAGERRFVLLGTSFRGRLHRMVLQETRRCGPFWTISNMAAWSYIPNQPLIGKTWSI